MKIRDSEIAPHPSSPKQSLCTSTEATTAPNSRGSTN